MHVWYYMRRSEIDNRLHLLTISGLVYTIRVVANCPFHHLLVIFVEYFQAFVYIAIMVNLVCYILLKFAYFVSFETINTLLDEKIILIMKIVTCGTAAMSVLAQLIWKVSE